MKKWILIVKEQNLVFENPQDRGFQAQISGALKKCFTFFLCIMGDPRAHDPKTGNQRFQVFTSVGNAAVL